MSKPLSRLGKTYRIMWDQNGGLEGFYDPPISPEVEAQAHLGCFEGTPVDAYVCAVGPDAGYTTSYPTKVPGMEFIVDRLNAGATVGGIQEWRAAENLRQLWQNGRDPFQIQIDESRRLGIDFWFRLSMNDWHHADDEGRVVRLMGSRFYAEHPEYWIGKDGVDPAWPDWIQSAIARLQDFSHPQVRRLRLETAIEACDRYDAAGFQYDFMRVPGYFKHNQVEKNTSLMTQFIRDTRAAFDAIGKKKGRHIGLSVRVPNTIRGARQIGLDVPAWIAENLVDIVVPSTFFNADLEEDISEWTELARKAPVRIYPAFEEAYLAGHTDGVVRCFYNPPSLIPLTLDMINGIAARHWRNGADGLYVFNWFGVAPTYNFDNRTALDEIGNPLRLRFKNKRYVVMRTDASFPNCLPHPRPIPATIGVEQKTIHIDVADNLPAAGDRVKDVCLFINLANLTIPDRLEVLFNGKALACQNPLMPGKYHILSSTWQNFSVPPELVRCGQNEVSLRMVRRNPRLAEEFPIELADLELAVQYEYPNGPWTSARGFKPRT